MTEMPWRWIAKWSVGVGGVVFAGLSALAFAAIKAEEKANEPPPYRWTDANRWEK